MIERERTSPLLIVLIVVCAAFMVFGVAIEVFKGGATRSITEHAGTLSWTPRGPDPDPELGSRSWTFTYPAAYSSRVHSGIGVYLGDKRIGFVRASEVSQGSVWVYTWIAPEYTNIAAGTSESEPIETPEGPRVEIYRYSTVPPANSTAA